MGKVKVPTKEGYYDIHDSETGEFAPKEGELSSSFDDDDFDLESLFDIEIDDDIASIIDDSDVGGEAIKAEKKTYELTPEQNDFIEKLGFGDVELSLINEFEDFDEDKIISASDDELRKLLKARLILDKLDDLVASDKELNDLKSQKFDGLWKDTKDASDYEELSTTKSAGADFTRFEAKKNYFEMSSSGSKEEKLNQLNELKELGEKYNQRKNEIIGNFEGLKKFVDSYIDKSSSYSAEKRKNAKIFSTSEEALEKFNSKSLIDSLKKDDPDALEAVSFYTGSYHIINEPLRGVHYMKEDPSPFGFVDTVEAMSRAIDKSTFDFDYTVERGTGHVTVAGGRRIGPELSDKQLKDFIGLEFKQQSFCSTSAVESTVSGSEFDKGCLLHIYCPKGTKGMFVYDVARYKKKQYEMILQRGYSYKINNVYRKGGKVHIECDVVLGSDEEKYSTEDLRRIERMYVD